MSSFENYTHTSKDYDRTRQAVGLEIIGGCLLAGGLDLKHSVILDAGCGTGSYTRALLPYVGKIIGVDMNSGMLAQAQAKLVREIESGKVELCEGDLTQLQLATASLDGAMMNQVLHHLPDTRQDGWGIRRQLFAELARVIRPGGVFILNACTPVQIRQGWWFYPLIPQALKRMCERHLERDEIIDLLNQAGFEYRGCSVPVEAILQGEHYFDAHGPKQAAWRNGDSIWADVSQQELRTALAKLQELHDSGTIEDFMTEHERRRLEVGQLSIFHAVRRAQ